MEKLQLMFRKELMSDFKESRQYLKRGYINQEHAYSSQITCFKRQYYDEYTMSPPLRNGTQWCLYLYIFKSALPNLFAELVKDLDSIPWSETIDAIDFHNGCNFLKLENENCIKMGCSFDYTGDDYYRVIPMDEWSYFIPLAEKYEANLIKLINKYDNKEASK